MIEPENHYSVIVYCDEGREERYLFKDVRDIATSIEWTWSKIPESIIVTWNPPLTGQTVRVNDKATGKMLLDCFRITERDILDGPTHF